MSLRDHVIIAIGLVVLIQVNERWCQCFGSFNILKARLAIAIVEAYIFRLSRVVNVLDLAVHKFLLVNRHRVVSTLHKRRRAQSFALVTSGLLLICRIDDDIFLLRLLFASKLLIFSTLGF